MINYMQTNQDNLNNNYIISKKNFVVLYTIIKTKNEANINKYINNLSLDYNLDKKSIIKYLKDSKVTKYITSSDCI